VPLAQRPAALDALAVNGADTGPLARGVLHAALTDHDRAARAHAFTALAMLGERSAGARYRLIDALVDEDAHVRAAAAAALVEVGGDDTRDELIRPAHDRDPLVRAALARALVAHADRAPGAAAPIARRLFADADPTVRAALVTTAPCAAAQEWSRALRRQAADDPALRALVREPGADATTLTRERALDQLLTPRAPIDRAVAAAAWLEPAPSASVAQRN
jgi:HEAT repeat protein